MMKPRITCLSVPLLIGIFVCCMYGVETAYSQWLPSQQLTEAGDSSLTSHMGARNLVVHGETVHIAWVGKKNGYRQVFHKYSTDAGITWSRDFPCSANEFKQKAYRPGLAVSGDTVHMVWYGWREGINTVYYRRSTNCGKGWQPAQKIPSTRAMTVWPSIVCRGTDVHIAWTDGRLGKWDLVYIRSTDGGDSWGEEQILADHSLSALFASLSVQDSVLYIGWYYYGGPEIEFSCYRRSVDGGETWEDEQQILEDPQILCSGLNIKQSGSHVYMAWGDKRTGSWDIYVRHSSDHGESWSEDMPYLNRQLTYLFPNIAVRGEEIHLAYVDDTYGLGQVRYARSTTCGAEWSTWDELSAETAEVRFPHIALGEHDVHVLWADTQNEETVLRYRRNPTGIISGVKEVATEIPSHATLGAAYPNPATARCSMDLSLLKQSRVVIALYDVLGRERLTLINETRNAGTHILKMDVSTLPTGTYFCLMKTGGIWLSRKISVKH